MVESGRTMPRRVPNERKRRLAECLRGAGRESSSLSRPNVVGYCLRIAVCIQYMYILINS